MYMYVRTMCMHKYNYVHVPTQLLPATAFENCPDILKVDNVVRNWAFYPQFLSGYCQVKDCYCILANHPGFSGFRTFVYSLQTFPDFFLNFPVFVGCYPNFCTLEVGRYAIAS